MAILDPSVEHLQFSAAGEGLDAVPKPTSGKPLGLALKAEDVDQFRRKKRFPMSRLGWVRIEDFKRVGPMSKGFLLNLYAFFDSLYLHIYIYMGVSENRLNP